jgi:tetratricopeptide (TPR) repeat protein
MQQSRDTYTVLYLLAAIVLLTVVSYSNSFSCGWHFDDYRCIVEYDYEHATPVSLFTFSPGRFIGFLTFWLNYKWCGYTVAGWHMVNLLIHLVNILLVFVIAVRLVRDAATRISNPQKERAIYVTAAVVAAVFAVHPIQTQAVTYIVQRLELLGTTWVLLTFLFLLNAISNSGRIARILWYTAAVLTFILGLFTKEFIVVAPLLAGAYYVVVKLKSWKKRLYVTGIALVCACAGIAGVLYYCKALTFSPYPQISMVPFARLWDDQPPPSLYYPTQVRVLLMYLRLCLFPFNQHVEYAIMPSSSFLDPLVLGAAGIQAGIVAAACFAWRRRPMILFGLLWFYIFLAPSSSLLPNGMYEHRLYGPMIGILIALFIPLAAEILDQPARYRKTLASISLSLAAFLIICFCFLTYNRNEVWQTGLSLWGDALRKSPNSWRANANYCKELMEEERYIEALPYIERGYQLNTGVVEVAINLGVCRYYTGNTDGAIAAFEHALNLQPRLKDIHDLVIEYLCVVYYDKARKSALAQDNDTARTYLKRILELQPDNPDAIKLQEMLNRNGTKE